MISEILASLRVVRGNRHLERGADLLAPIMSDETLRLYKALVDSLVRDQRVERAKRHLRWRQSAK